jgi:hypothetical protein
MNYLEFSHLKQLEDPQNPFSRLYEYPTGERFYVEGSFYTQLCGLEQMKPNSICDIINEMEAIVKNYKKVIFTMDYENPVTHIDGFIYQEITDITDALGIYIEDKSRGSDYGD